MIHLRSGGMLFQDSRRLQGLITICGVIWTGLIVAGFSILGHEEFTPVAAGVQAASFPQGSAVQLALDRPTLVLFAHPLCPCTRASLHELDQLLADAQNQVSTTIIFTIPDGVAEGWELGDLWNSAHAMPGVRVIRDVGGKQARLFGVTGSGHTLLYAPTGELLFSGGITESRGHDGDNPGRTAVANMILHRPALVNRTPVFGCSLL